MILAGDVGGTKTRLALFEPGSPARTPLLERRLESRAYPTLEALVGDFLAGAPVRPRRAVLGIAGPVVEGRVDATNLPWRADAAALAAALDIPEVRLMNDLESTAWGLSLLTPAEVEVLQPGLPAAGNRALIAAGTGLGEVVLVWTGAAWRPSASEGGHADFGPRDPLEDELLQWLRAKYGRASYERILSGPGLADLYRFMSESGRGPSPRQRPEGQPTLRGHQRPGHPAAALRTALQPARRDRETGSRNSIMASRSTARAARASSPTSCACC
ncbi:MAG: glucokinase [Candidatus Eisenbacteria bacterium]|nr:glucokinase [Candidatus Eisenbacteria bacterium]